MTSSPQTASEQLTLFRKTLTTALADQDTDPESATVEAAHSSGLHGYVARLDSSIREKRAQIGTLTAQVGAPAPTVEGDPARNLTAFEAAAPVLRANAKARVRRSIGVIMTEVGLIGLAIWVIWVLTEYRHPEDPGPPRDYFPRLALLVAIGVMIISALSGIVYTA
jgi:hypothetical protein